MDNLARRPPVILCPACTNRFVYVRTPRGREEVHDGRPQLPCSPDGERLPLPTRPVRRAPIPRVLLQRQLLARRVLICARRERIMTTVELRWLPHRKAYAVRIGCQIIGLIRCGHRHPFLPIVQVVYA